MRSDCTATYSVTDYKATTVGEFINEVLSERPFEWGDIWDSHNNIIAGYKYGNIVANYLTTTKLMNRRIIKIIGDGGWSRMDYTIFI